MLSSFLEDSYTASLQVFCKRYLGVGGHGMLYTAVVRLRYLGCKTGVLYLLQPDGCWLLTKHQSISSAATDISREGWKNETEKVLGIPNQHHATFNLYFQLSLPAVRLSFFKSFFFSFLETGS